MNVPSWNGTPREAAFLWRLTKDGRNAECRLWTHPLGAELRVDSGGEMVRTEAGRDPLLLIELAATWRQQFQERRAGAFERKALGRREAGVESGPNPVATMPPDHLRYGNPPAREAVCELRFSRGTWDAAIPGLVYVQLKDIFPERANVSQVVFAAGEGLKPGAGPTQIEVAQVSRFVQPDGLAFVQFAPHVISLHRKAPYLGWNSFSPLIKKVFHAYVEEAKPDRVERIGLRFVNDFRTTLRDVVFEPKDYFNFFPHIGPELPQHYADLFTRVVFPFKDEDAALRLQLYSEPFAAVDGPRSAMILDLDYFSTVPQGVGLNETVPWLEKAHDNVRSVFEASLTQRLRELLEPLTDTAAKKRS